MGICIFCDNPANSKEDMFPKWLLKRVRTGQPMYRKRANRPVKVTPHSTVKIKCVCKPCNNEWMSQLESKCIPLIGSLLNDFELWIDEEYQTLLSAWTVKVAMINDAVESHDRFFTRTECEAFRLNRVIPFGLEVNAARFTGSSLDANGSDFTLTNPAGELLAKGHVFHLLIGHLILEAVALHPVGGYENAKFAYASMPGYWNESIIRIWQPTKPQVKWPPILSYGVGHGKLHYGWLRSRWKNPTGHIVTTRNPLVPKTAQ